MAQYNDKQLVILESVIRLMEEGVDLRDLKAADIAEAAGIGKGTLYLYFSSKEDIILQALLHRLDVQVEQMVRRVAEKERFREKCLVILRFCRGVSAGDASAFRLAMKAIGSLEPSRILEEGKAFLQQRERDIARALLEVARCGKEEGVIAPPEDAAYTLLVFNSVIQGVYHAGCSGAYADGEKLEEDAYTLLVRALNESGNKNGIE